MLVRAEHLTNWVEAVLLPTATAKSITKIILEQIIAQVDLVENIDSDNRSHFTAIIIKNVMKGLDID
jgi:hypothetical protein